RLATSRAIDTAARSGPSPTSGSSTPTCSRPTRTRASSSTRQASTTGTPRPPPRSAARPGARSTSADRSSSTRPSSTGPPDPAAPPPGSAPLPPRLAAEQAAALDVAADTLGHDREAVQRTFRARYHDTPTRSDADRSILRRGARTDSFQKLGPDTAV